MCKVLQLPRSTYYYGAKWKNNDTTIETAVIKIFKFQERGLTPPSLEGIRF